MVCICTCSVYLYRPREWYMVACTCTCTHPQKYRLYRRASLYLGRSTRATSRSSFALGTAFFSFHTSFLFDLVLSEVKFNRREGMQRPWMRGPTRHVATRRRCRRSSSQAWRSQLSRLPTSLHTIFLILSVTLQEGNRHALYIGSQINVPSFRATWPNALLGFVPSCLPTSP